MPKRCSRWVFLLALSSAFALSRHANAEIGLGWTGPTLFPQGTSDVTLTAGTSVPILSGKEYFYSPAISYGFYPFDNFSIRPGLAFNYGDTEFKDVLGGEFNILLRYNYLTIGKFSTFIDAGAGVCYFDHRLTQPDGTNFNFSLRSGLGATYQIQDNTHLVLGAQWIHFSNAGLQGADRHTGSNGVLFYAGVMWTF